MNSYTTSIDFEPDAGRVDMGYHYSGSLGVELWMPNDVFQPWDFFTSVVTVSNPGPEPLHDVPLFVILDVFDELYFWPGFNRFDYLLLDTLEPGERSFEVIPLFRWPAGLNDTQGVYWHSAMTDPGITELSGIMDSWKFDWNQTDE